jgi:predicted dehydrogenase
VTHKSFGVGFVGCGYVADFYGATLPNHSQLSLVGAADVDADRAASFAARYGGRTFATLDELLACPNVDIVVNLTPPSEHNRINHQVVSAGRHLYSEKPLAMTASEANDLVVAAEAIGVALGAAPCSILGEAATTLAMSVSRGDIGSPRLVYAELDNGSLPLLGSRGWYSARGIPWPTDHEIRTGCTLEHSPYYVTWLVTLFGPVVEMQCSTASLMLDLWDDEEGVLAPDFSVGVLRMASGVVVRITTGWVAPSDLSLTIVGTEGVLRVDEAWSYRSAVTLRRVQQPRGKDHAYLADPCRVPLEPTPWAATSGYDDTHEMDMCRGIAELAQHIRTGCKLTVPPSVHAHITDVCLRLAQGVSGEVPAPESSTVKEPHT